MTLRASISLTRNASDREILKRFSSSSHPGHGRQKTRASALESSGV